MVDKQTTVKDKHIYSVEGRRETVDFDNFQNAALGPDMCLGPYLKDGGFVQKEAHSATLRVVRGNE